MIIAPELGSTSKQEDESVFEEVQESGRAALSEVEFEEAVAKGRAMTMEQAIQLALT